MDNFPGLLLALTFWWGMYKLLGENGYVDQIVKVLQKVTFIIR